MSTRLWLLKRNEYDQAPIYDCVDGIVVRAETATDARTIAAGACGDEGPDVWFDHDKTTCVELLQSGDKGAILIDYHAG